MEILWKVAEILWKFTDFFLQFVCNDQCHAEGGATKGGVSKREQMQTNADKSGQTQANAEAQTQANASKRGQTQTNAYTPLYCGFLHPSLQSP